MDRYEVIVVGAGPGGLACARVLAEGGCRVLMLERSEDIGAKVCAGGVTWDGLIQRVPESLLEKVFDEQDIFTPWQQVTVREKTPIVATVNRRLLGRWMAERAVAAGVELRSGAQVCGVDDRTLTVRRSGGRNERISCDHLVGADGSASLVRRSLGLASVLVGVGMHACLRQRFLRMEWHLNPAVFGCGYAWVFPHRETASVGIYGLRSGMNPTALRKAMFHWAAERGIDLAGVPLRAALVNCDYRGHKFGRTWLVGDAAGLASGLTGEGIFPAMLSGEAVAEAILARKEPAAARRLQGLLRRQRLHHRVQELAASGRLRAGLLVEVLVLLLRWRLLSFSALEMAA